mmetsp:Transcript_4268/g.4798  ORF Transcript_4268/g.4798 Transcript_4268/m.4798 type:complete len:105 (+) Transcript_4268:136-450(+)
MAAQRPLLFVLLATACLWLFCSQSPEVFVQSPSVSPTLRGAFTGNTAGIPLSESPSLVSAVCECQQCTHMNCLKALFFAQKGGSTAYSTASKKASKEDVTHALS